MPILKEFRDFVMRGNVVDLAVAVIVGGAFTGIVASLTDDVITPLILTPALKFAKVQDLDALHWGAVKYGKFLSAVIKFLLFAFILFMIIKLMKSLEKKAVPPAAGPTPTEKLLAEIRDELKNKNTTGKS